ncbi:MAG: UDP-N-acetylmuramate dehydrogenase [Alistipes sp.]|nr:UDP-N-acetylmuramate dehydrogenase [Alistipes sp.]
MIREFQKINLRERNSFGVEQYAEHLIEFDQREELLKLFREGLSGEWRVISGGNNILFTKDFEGTLLCNRNTDIEVLESGDERVRLRVGGGVEWDDFVEWSVENGLWGVENLSLIPGKVGAAPVQNIGAYGSEARDTIVSVEFFDTRSLEFREMDAAECSFGYRESIFKHELKGCGIIFSVEFELSRVAQPKLGYGDVIREVESRGGATLRNIREAICSIRRSKLPDTKELGNAGSFFKNPVVAKEVAENLKSKYPEMPTYPLQDGEVKLAAGWLIDKAGLKGYRNGRVGVHAKQALVLVNHGGATGGDVIELAHYVQQRVKDTFGVEIHAEVNIW